MSLRINPNINNAAQIQARQINPAAAAKLSSGLRINSQAANVQSVSSAIDSMNRFAGPGQLIGRGDAEQLYGVKCIAEGGGGSIGIGGGYGDARQLYGVQCMKVQVDRASLQLAEGMRGNSAQIKESAINVSVNDAKDAVNANNDLAARIDDSIIRLSEEGGGGIRGNDAQVPQSALSTLSDARVDTTSNAARNDQLNVYKQNMLNNQKLQGNALNLLK